MSGLGDIRNQVMWNRLISVVEEQALTLIRTAFSTSVREAGDLSAGVFDPRGRMLAQAVTGTPGHVNTMEAAVRNFLDVFPEDDRLDGDDWITNDPWLGTGHLHDITMVTPAFHNGRLVAYFACTAHVVDIGGRGFGADGNSVYEEGIQIPIMKFAHAGEVNRELLRVLAPNLREPGQVIGDIHSLAACNRVGQRRLSDMLDEAGLDGLDALGAYIFSHSEAATLERINALPAGRYENAMRVDGYDTPIDLKVALTIGNEGVHADYTGTSPESAKGINVPMIYAKAYTAYGLKCAIAPDIPNNTASLAPFTVTAPPGTILNAQRPAPVALRHVVGQMLPDVVFGALEHAIPGRVPAEGASSLWNVQFSIRPLPGHEGRRAEVLMFNSGGTGARPGLDGLGATAFPSGVMTMPIEATEQTGPIVFWRKELRPDSGGPGRTRGGLGQVLEIEALPGHRFDFSAMFDRCRHPARGRAGGGPGGRGVVRLDDGTGMQPKGWQPVPPGRRLILEAAGGGGYGPPAERPAAAIRADLAAGYVTPDHVRAGYGRDPDKLED